MKRSALKAPSAAFAEALEKQTAEQRKFVDDGYVHGFAQVLFWRGSVAHRAQYGVADPAMGAPFTEDTLVRIFSMTKPLTAVGVMILVEKGKLHLDRPVSEYLPCFRDIPYVHSANQIWAMAQDARSRRGPTVRQLLMHTSGLSYGASFGDRPRYACEKEYAEVVRRVDEGEIVSLATFVEALAALPLRFRPGSRWEYSHGFDVLGCVIEVISGQSLDRFLHERIFAPLRMRDTSFSVPRSKVGRFAALFRQGPTGREADVQRLDGGVRSAWVRGRQCGVLSGGGFMGSSSPASEGAVSSVGGVVSTLRDYARFVRMLSGFGKCPTTGARILKEETVRHMSTNWLIMRNVVEAGQGGRVRGWHDAGRGTIGWCPLGQVSKGEGPPKLWMGGLAGTFWAIDRERDLVVLHVTQVAGSYDFYGTELWEAGKAACAAAARAEAGEASRAPQKRRRRT